MSLPVADLQQLHFNILDYLTKRSRIMYARRLSAWNDFASYYNYQYSDYSREDLRREFITTILPKVFTYNLTNVQRRKVEIFATHYHFGRSADGFYEEPETRLPIEGVHYVRSETNLQFPRIACVLSPSEYVHEIPSSDVKITAWVSAINSSDSEVANYSIYRGKHLCTRVTKTRKDFQQTGQLPENMNPEINKKIISFRNKAEKLSSIVRNHSFSEEQ